MLYLKERSRAAILQETRGRRHTTAEKSDILVYNIYSVYLCIIMYIIQQTNLKYIC